MLKRVFWSLAGLFFLVMLVMAFTPVPAPIPQNCKTQTGIVVGIYSPCCFDVAFKLKNDPHQYYINRGLENGEVDMEELKSTLIDQEVAFEVIRRNWSPMDPQNKMAPVAEIRKKDKVIFSRMINE